MYCRRFVALKVSCKGDELIPQKSRIECILACRIDKKIPIYADGQCYCGKTNCQNENKQQISSAAVEYEAVFSKFYF